MIFDTHAHYDDDAFDENRETLLAQLKAAGIERVVNVGASIHSSHTTLELIEKHDFLYGAIGVHPSETEELNEEWMNWLEEKSHEKKVVAIGETTIGKNLPGMSRNTGLSASLIWQER